MNVPPVLRDSKIVGMSFVSSSLLKCSRKSRAIIKSNEFLFFCKRGSASPDTMPETPNSFAAATCSSLVSIPSVFGKPECLSQ